MMVLEKSGRSARVTPGPALTIDAEETTAMARRTIPQQKRCAKCGRTLPREAFHKQNKERDGIRSRCKECILEPTRTRLYREAKARRDAIPENRERARELHTSDRGKETGRRCRDAWRKKKPLGHYAQNLVYNAVRSGRLVRGPCERCGKRTGVHGHHDDYSKPLEVRWLCGPCHGRVHSDARLGLRQER